MSSESHGPASPLTNMDRYDWSRRFNQSKRLLLHSTVFPESCTPGKIFYVFIVDNTTVIIGTVDYWNDIYIFLFLEMTPVRKVYN